jgi:hypothetical protein
MKRGKSRLIIAKNDIDHLIPTISIADPTSGRSSLVQREDFSRDRLDELYARALPLVFSNDRRKDRTI